MARSFHRRSTLAPVAELNVTNMIDLGFSLLIIFMIATPLIQNERAIPVDLPVSTESPSRSPEQRFVDIVILPQGYQMDGALLSRDQLEANLRVLGASANPPVVAISADRGIQYQEVVTVMDLLSQNKLTKISLPTQLRR